MKYSESSHEDFLVEYPKELLLNSRKIAYEGISGRIFGGPQEERISEKISKNNLRSILVQIPAGTSGFISKGGVVPECKT